MKQRILLFLTGLLCTAFLASAQTTVNGIVVDAQGEPVVGAAVFVEGNQNVGTLTDLVGNFTLKNVPDRAILPGISRYYRFLYEYSLNRFPYKNTRQPPDSRA